MKKFGFVLFMLAMALMLTGSALAQNAGDNSVYFVSYYSNANTAGAPDGVVRAINDGDQATTASEGIENGPLWATFYIFDDSEELQSCCACLVTSDGIVSESVNKQLTNNEFTGRAEIMDAPGVGGLGGTYGGNPLACAAALAVIETLERDNLPARAEQIGGRFDARARAWKKRWPLIGDVRGLGAMRALELVRPGATREPAKEETDKVLQHCHGHGLILVSAGSYGNVIRLLMPLIITDAQFDEGLDVLEGALMHVAESVEAAPRHA